MTGKEKKTSIHERLEINKKIIQGKQGQDKMERGADLGVRTVQNKQNESEVMDNTVASNFLFDVKNFYMTNFFQEGNSENLTEKQKEVLGIWNDLSTNEQETVMSMLRGLRKQENSSSICIGCSFFVFER